MRHDGFDCNHNYVPMTVVFRLIHAWRDIKFYVSADVWHRQKDGSQRGLHSQTYAYLQRLTQRHPSRPLHACTRIHTTLTYTQKNMHAYKHCLAHYHHHPNPPPHASSPPPPVAHLPVDNSSRSGLSMHIASATGITSGFSDPLDYNRLSCCYFTAWFPFILALKGNDNERNVTGWFGWLVGWLVGWLAGWLVGWTLLTPICLQRGSGGDQIERPGGVWGGVGARERETISYTSLSPPDWLLHYVGQQWQPFSCFH